MSIGTHSIRRTGSAALNLAYVASGAFEVFYATRINPWDVAADFGVGCDREFSGWVRPAPGGMLSRRRELETASSPCSRCRESMPPIRPCEVSTRSERPQRIGGHAILKARAAVESPPILGDRAGGVISWVSCRTPHPPRRSDPARASPTPAAVPPPTPVDLLRFVWNLEDRAMAREPGPGRDGARPVGRSASSPDRRPQARSGAADPDLPQRSRPTSTPSGRCSARPDFVVLDGDLYRKLRQSRPRRPGVAPGDAGLGGRGIARAVVGGLSPATGPASSIEFRVAMARPKGRRGSPSTSTALTLSEARECVGRPPDPDRRTGGAGRSSSEGEGGACRAGRGARPRAGRPSEGKRLELAIPPAPRPPGST